MRALKFIDCVVAIVRMLVENWYDFNTYFTFTPTIPVFLNVISY